MSEKSKVEDTAEAVADEPVDHAQVADEVTPEEPQPEEPQPEEPPVAKRVASRHETSKRVASRHGSSPVSWLALFLSLVTLAAVGYMVMEDQRTRDTAANSSDSLAQLSGRVDESRQSLAKLDQDLANLATSDESIQSRVELLQQGIEEQVQLLDSLPGRMSNLENSVASLQGVSAGARDTWLLAEAEYYMQIANAQLQLGNNPHLAMLALGMADERVVQMANPALTDVRRAISDELAALEVMQKPDIEGVTLTLASLARVVESLPLRSVDQATVDDDETVDAESGGAARAWASVKGAVSGLVKVTPPDEATKALLTPDTAQLVRTNLALQLQAARLALLRGEQAIFEQSLDDADALLTEFFELGSTQVMSAQQTLTEIRDSMIVVTAPDISESLRLTRQFRALSEIAQ